MDCGNSAVDGNGNSMMMSKGMSLMLHRETKEWAKRVHIKNIVETEALRHKLNTHTNSNNIIIVIVELMVLFEYSQVQIYS